MTAHAFRHPVPLEGGDDLVAGAPEMGAEKRLISRASA